MNKTIADRLAEARAFFKEHHGMRLTYATDNVNYMEATLLVDPRTVLIFERKQNGETEYRGIPQIDSAPLGVRKNFTDQVHSIAEYFR